jgi:hypothetical protein
MKSRRVFSIGMVTLLALAAILDAAEWARAQTPSPTPGALGRFAVRFRRPAEDPVLPGLGSDVWRFNADVDLPADFVPNSLALTITTPTVNGLQPLIHPLNVDQFTQQSDRRWGAVTNDEDNGKCLIAVVRKTQKWTVTLRCTGSQILPEFAEDTNFFRVTMYLDEHGFTNLKELRQVRETMRRYP